MFFTFSGKIKALLTVIIVVIVAETTLWDVNSKDSYPHRRKRRRKSTAAYKAILTHDEGSDVCHDLVTQNTVDERIQHQEVDADSADITKHAADIAVKALSPSATAEDSDMNASNQDYNSQCTEALVSVKRELLDGETDNVPSSAHFSANDQNYDEEWPDDWSEGSESADNSQPSTLPDVNSSQTLRSLKCDQCDFVAKRSYNLNRHIRGVHIGDRPYTCDLCDNSFVEKSDVQRHKRNVHFVVSDDTHQCTICTFSCNNTYAFNSHMKNHVFMDDTKVEKVLEQKTKNVLVCPHCDYSTIRMGHLNRHIRTHTGERPYPCKLCSYQSSDTSTLRSHVQRIHGVAVAVLQAEEKKNTVLTVTAKKIHKCPHCAYTTVRSGHLTRHIRTHTGEKPYSCDLCSYKTGDTGSLRKHRMNMHVEEPKSNQCPYCRYSTKQASYLKHHIEKFHSEDGIDGVDDKPSSADTGSSSSDTANTSAAPAADKPTPGSEDTHTNTLPNTTKSDQSQAKSDDWVTNLLPVW